jgi:hypothetical protein
MLLENVALRPCSGGMICEEAIITTTRGDAFSAVSFRGDFEGWAAGVNAYAKRENLLTARIVGAGFCVSDGFMCRVEDCQVEFTDTSTA